MADFGLLEVAVHEQICRIVLNRPDKRNALSLDMISELSKALDFADRDNEARVIVIAANGPVFSSGHDLRELTEARNDPDLGRAFFEKTMRSCSAMMQKIVNHRLPVLAEVRGTASAAGCQLVATCDLAVASHNAKFITPGVNIGLFCSTPMVALSRNVSRKQALEMLLTGEACDAARAVEIGLVNKAVDEDLVTETVAELASRIASKSAMTQKIGKQAFYNQVQMPLSEAYDYCAEVMVENMLKHDAEEGINAFLEKREPSWRDE